MSKTQSERFRSADGLVNVSDRDLIERSADNATTLRKHVMSVTERVEAELGEEKSCFIDGGPVDWEQLPIPEGRIVVYRPGPRAQRKAEATAR